MHLNLCAIFLSLGITSISSENINSTEIEQKQHITSAINELNHRLHIEWNLLIVPGEHQHVDIVIKSLRIPMLLITKTLEIQINLLHSHQVMSVVFLDERTFETGYEIVERQLELLKFRPIIWIIPESQQEDLLNFATKNWFSGFTRVLFFTQQGLFTYDPIPAIRIERMRHIQDFARRKEITDFKKYYLNIMVLEDPPLSFHFQIHSGEQITTGFFYKILQIFIQRYNFQENQYDVLAADEPSDIQTLTERFKNNTMDIVPAALYEYKSEYAIKSKAVWIVKSVVVLPYPSPLSKMLYLHYPFTFSTKITIVFLLILYAAALTFIYYRSDTQHKIAFSNSILYVLVSFICQSHFNLKIETTRQKIVFFLLFLNGFIITNLYLAKLSSIMVKNIYESKLEKLDDLNKTSLKILMQPSYYEFFATLPYVDTSIKKKIKVVEKDYFDRACLDMNNTYLLMLLEDRMLFVFFQQQFLKTPRMYDIKEGVLILLQFFTVRKNLQYIQLFNRYLDYLLESGIMDKIIQETYFDGIKSGEIRFFTDNQEDLFLNLESLYAIFTYFIYCIALSLAVFVAEIVRYRFNK